MRRNFYKKFIAALALAAMTAALLSGCSAGDTALPADDTASAPEEDTQPVQEGYSAADSDFSINYAPSESLNPFKSTNAYNEQIFGLLYEGLFALDSSLSPQPVLCESYDTADGVTYTINIVPGVKLHNDHALTAVDVADSINAARSSSKYASRLSCIASASSNGDLTVTVTLHYANYRLPSLLDIPIVESGTANDDTPVGTGPYTRSSERLTAFSGYRAYDSLSLKNIYLKSVATDGLAEAFSERTVDILGYDPTGIGKLNVHMVHETRSCATTDFIYLGFNTTSGVTASAGVRRALGYLVDTETVCTGIFNSGVLKSPLVLSPALTVYDDTWEDGAGYSRQNFSSLCSTLGLTDDNHDGYLEYSGAGFSLRFIVNSENTYKAAAAQRIVTDMQNMGVNVTLDVLSWSDYNAALASGDYSIYLGEAKLQADFDLSALLCEGGSLNYGGIADTRYSELINAYLGAAEGDELTAAAKALCDYVKEQAPIIPIAYKKYLVLSHVGVISGAEPSQSSIYYNVAEWKFTLQ